MYLVRNIESKNLLGMFASRSISGLFSQIDSETDPFEFEYLLIKTGGFIFDEDISGEYVPYDEENESDEDVSSFPTATMNDWLYDKVRGNPSVWKKFTRKNHNDCYR